LAEAKCQLSIGTENWAWVGVRWNLLDPREHPVSAKQELSPVQPDIIQSTAGREGSALVFPADRGAGHFIGVVRVLDRICAKASLKAVTPRIPRHTFAGVARDLGFSELTIADLFGHSARGVTQAYVHLDGALIVAADRVSVEVARNTRRQRGAVKTSDNLTARKVVAPVAA
jgi:integrase